MLSEVEASLIFRRRQHKTQSEILRFRFASLRMTKATWSIAFLATIPGDFRNREFVAAGRVCPVPWVVSKMLPDKCAGAGEREAAGFKAGIP
jgi:hypothetical protein